MTNDTRYIEQRTKAVVARAREILNGYVTGWEKKRDSFIADLATGPVHAFSWSRDVVAAACLYEEALRDMSYLDDDGRVTPEIDRLRTIYHQHIEQAISAARNSPPGSSSMTSNLVEAYKGAAHGKIVSDLKWSLDSLDHIQEGTEELLLSDTTPEQIAKEFTAAIEKSKTQKERKARTRVWSSISPMLLDPHTFSTMKMNWIEVHGRGRNLQNVFLAMCNEAGRKEEAKKAA